MLTTERTIDLERRALGEVEMLGEERWEEIHRRAAAGASIRAIARELDLDRKTVRRCLRQSEWRPYQRAAPEDTLLAPHATYLRQRAAEVGYSARVLFQELRRRRYEGSYETVKRFVRPLRETSLQAAVTRTRFETPLDRRGERGLDTLRGVLVRSATQSRKLDRNPCGTAAMPSSLISWLSVASESGLPRGFVEYGDHVGDHDAL